MTISVYRSLYKIANTEATGSDTPQLPSTPTPQSQNQGRGRTPEYTFWNWLSRMSRNPFGTFTGGFTGRDPWGRAMSYGLTGFGGAGLLSAMMGLPKWLPWLVGLGGGLYGYFTGNRGTGTSRGTAPGSPSAAPADSTTPTPKEPETPTGQPPREQ